jgi:hypothetical protein
VAENFDEIHDPFDRQFADERGILRSLCAKKRIGARKLKELTGLSFATAESFFVADNIRHTKRTMDKIHAAVGSRTAILDDENAPLQPNEVAPLTKRERRAVNQLMKQINSDEKEEVKKSRKKQS